MLLQQNQSVLNCIVREVTDTGARIAFECATPLPDRFSLVFMSEREMREVRVQARHAQEVEVEFLSPPRSASHLRI